MTIAGDMLSAGRALRHGVSAESVTYTVKPTVPGGSSSNVATSGVRGRVQVTPELVRDTWELPTADVTAAKRGDTVTDSAGDVWSVDDVGFTEGAHVQVFARKLQVRG